MWKVRLITIGGALFREFTIPDNHELVAGHPVKCAFGAIDFWGITFVYSNISEAEKKITFVEVLTFPMGD